MADLTFIDKLDENQLIVADKIVAKAKEMGVPPRLALSLAYVESGLRMGKTGDAGEIGIMQVKPNTGKLMGFDEKALRTEDGNIDAGLTYLKQGIERYKDPMLGVVAYNAGHDNDFLLGKSNNPPATTVQYINKINAVGGFTTPEAAAQAPADGSEAAPAASEVPDLAKPTYEVGSPYTDYRSVEAAGLGGMAGATLGEGKKLFGPKPAAPAPGTPVQKWAGAMGYGDRGAQTYKQAHEFEQGTRRGASIRNPATGETFKPEFRVAKPPVIEPQSGKIMSALRGTGNFLARSPVISGALTGAGVAGNTQEAMTRWNQGDVPGAVVSGVGALGAAASLAPHPLVKGIGMGLATASPAALYVLDKMRQREQGALPAQQTAP